MIGLLELYLASWKTSDIRTSEISRASEKQKRARDGDEKQGKNSSF